MVQFIYYNCDQLPKNLTILSPPAIPTERLNYKVDKVQEVINYKDLKLGVRGWRVKLQQVQRNNYY